MEPTTDILEELRSLSPLVAGIEKVNLFSVPARYFETLSDTIAGSLEIDTNKGDLAPVMLSTDVPAGYFENLAGSVINKIKSLESSQEEIQLSPLLTSIRHSEVFETPAGYFDELAENMMGIVLSRESARDEIRRTSRLLFKLQGINPFEVPEGYFDALSQSAAVKFTPVRPAADELLGLSPLLYQLTHQNVFEIPAGYFDAVSDKLVAATKVVTAKDELAQLSPLLPGLKAVEVLNVPVDYFDHLPAQILKKLHPAPAKIVHLPRRGGFVRYAIAAMLVGAMAVGIYKSVNTPGRVQDSAPVVTAKLDAAVEKGRSMNEQQFDEALNNLNQSDIAKYLENNGDVTDVTTLNNNLQNVSLPSQDEYLTDEKTLDNYLKELEKTTANN